MAPNDGALSARRTVSFRRALEAQAQGQVQGQGEVGNSDGRYQPCSRGARCAHRGHHVGGISPIYREGPGVTRRFQPIRMFEPDVARCCDMLRGILGPMEKHYKVRISDAAIVAAVTLSSRYIPARQLPDKR
jgi:hypothetical protein